MILDEVAQTDLAHLETTMVVPHGLIAYEGTQK